MLMYALFLCGYTDVRWRLAQICDMVDRLWLMQTWRVMFFLANDGDSPSVTFQMEVSEAGFGDGQDIKQVRMEDVKHRGCLIF